MTRSTVPNRQLEGEEITLTRLVKNFQQPDRGLREKAWKLKAARQLADVESINELWQKFMQVRARIAKNTDACHPTVSMPGSRNCASITPLKIANPSPTLSAGGWYRQPRVSITNERNSSDLTRSVRGTWWMAGTAAHTAGRHNLA